MADRREEPTPERIGIYRIERRIGQGGMGEVFLAWDDRLERRVAIKRIRQEAGLSTEQRERFRREARLAARLSHSGVVQIHDLVTEGTDDAIVMEYVEGQPLAERLAAGRLETGVALRLAREIAEGLAAAHEAGLIHRDLKAANVVVTPSGHAKILDFGLARLLIRSEETPLTRQGLVIGTIQSMSPEQARGQEVDARSDLFSLGVLLFEMLTGRNPFRGTDAMDTLRRVVHEPPPELRSLRPGLPAEVEVLLGRLLAKDREDRPASAGEVAAALERLRSGSGALPLPSESVSLSDLPTTPGRSLPLPDTGSAGSGAPLRSRRRLWAAAVLGLIALAALVLFLGRSWLAPAPRRVAVPPVEVIPADEERLALAGSGVLTALLSSLNGMEGLAPVDPREARRGGRSPVEIARVTAADDVLTAEVRGQGELAQVTLRRIQGSDGRVLWTDTFPVPAHAAGLRLLADAVAVKLRKAWPDHDLRPGVPELDVRDQDYAAFLEVKRRLETGLGLEPEMERLEAIVRSSPRFLEAQLLTSQVALNLFLSHRRTADLDRAAELIRQARALAPEDPRPLRQELQIVLAADRPGEAEAEAILSRLEDLLAGDPELLGLRAQVAERQGRRDEALSFLAEAARQAPSWQNLYRLATAEARNGQIATARGRLESILRQTPGNLWAQEALAHLELVYGDLARAEKAYQGLIAAEPGRALSNLGFARFLRGNYREAASAYRAVLELQPDRVFTLISLADAQVELGQTQEAQALYRRALSLLPADGTPATPAEAMLKAQCLARLGRAREAVDAAQTALRQNPEDPDLLYQSSMVLSLAGDRSSALNSALSALDKGVQPRWFAGSVFRQLREAPELRPHLGPQALNRSDSPAADRPGRPGGDR